MTVRPGTPADRDVLIALAAQFYAESPHGLGTPNPLRLTANVDYLLARGLLSVAEDRGGSVRGLLGTVVQDHPLVGVRTGFELAWYVQPAARGGSAGARLVRDAEAAVVAAGGTRMQIGAPDAQVAHFLERLGYRAVETTYVKELA